MELNSLLVATDLSPRSIRVATFAGLLAQRLDVPATYVHVDELATVSIHDSSEAQEYLNHIVSLREQGLRGLAEALARAGLDGPDVQVLQGRARDVLVPYALDHDFGAIAIGQRSSEALDQHLLGSTARRVLKTASVPVLAIPPDVVLPTARPVAFGPVVAPVVLDDSAIQTILAARAWARRVEAALYAVHALDFPNMADYLKADSNDLLRRVGWRMRLQAVARLSELAGSVGIDREHQIVVDGASPAEAVEAYAEKVGAGFVVVPASDKGSIARFFLGSTSDRLVKVARRPVLVLPRSWLDEREDAAEA